MADTSAVPPPLDISAAKAAGEQEEHDPIIREEVTPPHLPGSTYDAREDLIKTLTEELILAKADVARLSKERAYFKRKAEWATIEDQRLLSPVITSTDYWYDRTWLLLHEPIRQALLDFDELVCKSPSFDPVRYPWKVTNFFYYFDNAFAPYVRRHHAVEEKVYFPWVATRAEIPAAVLGGHEGMEQMIKDVEASQVEYKALVKALGKEKKAVAASGAGTAATTTVGAPPRPSEGTAVGGVDASSTSQLAEEVPPVVVSAVEPPQQQQGPLYEWRATLITRLTALAECLNAHMDEEEAFFPKTIYGKFSEKEEEAIIEKMSSAKAAHMELPMVCLAMDVWGTPEIKEAFLNKLSTAARYTLNHYWLSSYRKTMSKSLESLALEEPPPSTYMPHMSVNQLLVAAPVFLLCTIQ